MGELFTLVDNNVRPRESPIAVEDLHYLFYYFKGALTNTLFNDWHVRGDLAVVIPPGESAELFCINLQATEEASIIFNKIVVVEDA